MTVHFHGYVIDHAKGAASFQSETSETVRALIDELGDHFGQSFKDFLLGDETCLFLLNGRGLMTTGGFATKLSSEDKVEILPYVVAG